MSEWSKDTVASFKGKTEEAPLGYSTDGTDNFDTFYIDCEKFPQHDLYLFSVGKMNKPYRRDLYKSFTSYDFYVCRLFINFESQLRTCKMSIKYEIHPTNSSKGTGKEQKFVQIFELSTSNRPI